MAGTKQKDREPGERVELWVQLPAVLARAVKAEAHLNGKTMSGVMVDALSAWLEATPRWRAYLQALAKTPQAKERALKKAAVA